MPQRLGSSAAACTPGSPCSACSVQYRSASLRQCGLRAGFSALTGVLQKQNAGLQQPAVPQNIAARNLIYSQDVRLRDILCTDSSPADSRYLLKSRCINTVDDHIELRCRYILGLVEISIAYIFSSALILEGINRLSADCKG